MMQQSSGDRRQQYPISQGIPLNLVGSTKFGRYPKISTEATVNMIMTSDNAPALVHHYGYILAEIISKTGTAREIYFSPTLDKLIVVVDNGVYAIGPNPYPIARVGTLTTSSGFVYIAENAASQIALVDGVHIYIYNYALNTFTQVMGIDFKPVYIAYMDTYFICASGGTNQWQLSEQNNGLVWPEDGASVGMFETKPSTVVATVPLDRQLFVMSQTGTESWSDAPNANSLFPFQRNNSWSIDYGCISTQTIAVGYGYMVWLGNNEKSGLALMFSSGGQPQQISFDGLDFLFSSITTPSDSYGFLYKLDGHIYYQFTFVTDNLSFVFDLNTQKFFTMTDEDGNFHIAKRIAFFNNSYYFVSFRDGDLYQMGSEFLSYCDINGAPVEIPRIRVCDNIRFPNLDRFVVDTISITLESGINPSNPGNLGVLLQEDGSLLLQEDGVSRFLLEYNPLTFTPTNPSIVDLSVSRDGGYTYGNVVSKTLPPLGQRQNTFRFWNIGGQQNDLVMQFRFWGLGRFVITGAEYNIHL